MASRNYSKLKVMIANHKSTTWTWKWKSRTLENIRSLTNYVPKWYQAQYSIEVVSSTNHPTLKGNRTIVITRKTIKAISILIEVNRTSSSSKSIIWISRWSINSKHSRNKHRILSYSIDRKTSLIRTLLMTSFRNIWILLKTGTK